jgi:hypothetical protein
MLQWKSMICTAAISASLLIAGCGEINSREDFTAAVQSKSEAEVTKRLGKPAAVDSNDPNRVVWSYADRTFDIANPHQRDKIAAVIFGAADARGKRSVVGVEFK